MRQMIWFATGGDKLAGTLDKPASPTAQTTGLLIVSGGNEIRSGAFAGQAAIAAHFAAQGYPVFRYDRRGIGESEGENGGFESSSDDIAAAVSAFQAACPHLQKIAAFGNCDAASALALFHRRPPIDAMILANPWVLDPAKAARPDQAAPPPSAAAIRARYWNRLKNPRSVADLLSGRIDLRKLFGGLRRAAVIDPPGALELRISQALHESAIPVQILIARRDATAMAFMHAWDGAHFARIRAKPGIALAETDSASHGFAYAAAKQWLLDHVAGVLRSIA